MMSDSTPAFSISTQRPNFMPFRGRTARSSSEAVGNCHPVGLVVAKLGGPVHPVVPAGIEARRLRRPAVGDVRAGASSRPPSSCPGTDPGVELTSGRIVGGDLRKDELALIAVQLVGCVVEYAFGEWR